MRDLLLEQLQVSLTDRYRVERAIGHGSMATVYLARDLKHDRPVAIKALRPRQEDVAATERFLREIRYLANLQHPHILPLFDSGDALGIPFFVTAYIEGESLRHRLQRTPAHRLPIEDALRVARQVADALNYAHRRNVLHRDVKPENILLHEDHALVADFGIARAIAVAAEPTLTASGFAIGTPAYMSPEQLLADRQLDGSCDVYALAVMLYEMLLGALPFVGNRGVVDNARKFVDRPDKIRPLRDDVPDSVDQAIERALALAPEQRFESANNFARALGRSGDIRGA